MPVVTEIKLTAADYPETRFPTHYPAYRTQTFDPPLEHVTKIDFSQSKDRYGQPATIRDSYGSHSSYVEFEFRSRYQAVGTMRQYKMGPDENPIPITASFTSNEPFTLYRMSLRGYKRFSYHKGSPIVTLSTRSTFLVTTEPPPPLVVNIRAINALVTIEGNTGSYKLTYEGPDNIEVVVQTHVEQSVYNIVSLIPETEYVFRLYEGSELLETISATSLEDVSSNYVTSDFFDGKQFQLQELSKQARRKMSKNMNSVFNTGDILKVKMNREINAKFVKRGDTITSDGNNLLAPFVETDGSGQHFILQGDNTVTVGYDETSNTIVIDTVEYRIGDNLVLDGKKCTIQEYDEE